MNATSASFVGFLFLFTLIGVASTLRKRNTSEDYLVASRSVNPWLMALSAVATNNSGFMFIGLIGATYSAGISTAWLMVGWVFGDYLAWVIGVPRQVRERSERQGTVTIPSFIGHGMPGGRLVTRVAAVVVLAFLGTYAAAQLTAGSKALHVLFGWDESIGAILGAVIVGAYCFSGGIRASIWTDAAQSVVMLGAMIMLCLVATHQVGGWTALWSTLESADPKLVALVPDDLQLGFALFLFGWIVAGLGVVGQPHIMIRAMTIDSPDNMRLARRIYITWYTVFSAAAIGVGLTARVLLPETAGFDAELAMPAMAAQQLPGVLVGLVLAGLFSATMSTADSQVLSCSAAITHDLFPQASKSIRLVKAGTLGVTATVLVIALGGGTVFALVTLAWSGLASVLGPLVLLRALGRQVSAPLALSMMGAGLAGVLLWRYGLGLSGAMYEVLPGMLMGFAVYAAGSFLRFNLVPGSALHKEVM